MGVVITLLMMPLACNRPADSVSGPAQGPSATLQNIKGDVRVKHAAEDDWIPAHSSLGLFENDKVRTAKGASAVVQFKDGSSVAISEDALVGISETQSKPGHDRTDLTVLHGSVNAELSHPAQQSLTVSTPAATVRAGREIVFQ